MKEKTVLTKAGLKPHENHGIVNPPIYHASTILFATLDQFEGQEGEKPFTYARKGTPTSQAFEAAVAALEQGAGCVSTPSGLAAITLALQAVTQAGDHVLIADNAYPPTRIFADKILKKFAVEVTYYDPTDVQKLAELCQKNTRAIWMESPGSHSFEMTDVPAVVALAKDRNILTLIDNTWSGGYFFKPLTLGVDISVQAATKYIAGHSDVMMGVVTCNDKTHKRVRQTAHTLGICAGPDDHYLAQRGLRSMAVRLEAHYQAGLEIAQWLTTQPAVTRVCHPALSTDPGHAIWQRDFTGASSLFGFVTRPTSRDSLAAMLDNMAIFGMGFSWGGYESLLTPCNLTHSRTVRPWQEAGHLFRIHVGLEDVADLKEDLQQGFARLLAQA